jgi:hypothetical protein
MPHLRTQQNPRSPWASPFFLTAGVLLVVASGMLFGHTGIAIAYCSAALMLLVSFGLQIGPSPRSEFGVFSAAVISLTIGLSVFSHARFAVPYALGTVILSALAFQLTRDLSSIDVALRLAYQCTFVSTICSLLFFPRDTDGLEQLVPGVSSNGIPCLLLLLTLTRAIVAIHGGRSLPLIQSLSCVGISLIGGGRANLYLSVANMFLLLLLKSHRLQRKWVLCIALLVAALVCFEYQVEIYSWLVRSTKVGAGVDTPRWDLWSEYIHKLDGIEVIFGGSYEGTAILSEYQGNAHSSLIRAHHHFGLLGLLLLLMGIAISSARSFKLGLANGAAVSALSFLLLVRLAFDDTGFPCPLDLLTFLVIYASFHGRDRSRPTDTGSSPRFDAARVARNSCQQQPAFL